MAGFIETMRSQIDDLINDMNDDDEFQEMLSKNPMAKFSYKLGMVHGIYEVKIKMSILRFREWNLRRSNAFLQKNIKTPPANLLVRIVRFVFSKSSFENFFAQSIADMREEYFEALIANKKWLAHWRHVQIYSVTLMTIVAWISVSVFKKFSLIWKLL